MGKEMLRCAQHDSTDFVRKLPIARVSLVKYLIKRDAGCYCEVKRVAAANHGNFYHHIAQRLLFTGSSEPFAAHQQHKRKLVACFAVIARRCFGSAYNEIVMLLLPSKEIGEARFHQALREDCAHTGA